MKQLLSLNQDYIVVARFKENIIKGEKGNVTEWVDEKKDRAHGKNLIDAISVMVEKRDMNGYQTGSFDLIYLDKRDIIQLSKKIEEIESAPQIGHVGDELPF